MIKVLELARPDILSLQPYQHAAWQPSLERLHANEMPWRAEGDTTQAGLNRYPEPQPHDLVEHLARLYKVASKHVLVGRGSDEGIDLLIRAFCRAGEDAVLICPPTFGMYKVSARIQGAAVIEVPLVKENDFALDPDAVLAACDQSVKILFVCSPNNPTGNLVDRRIIARLCTELRDRTLVVVDEAYIEFADAPSVTDLLSQYSNLVVLRTLSKAYALAGARCGTLIAHEEIVSLLARVITPYALPAPTIESVLRLTDPGHQEAARKRIQHLIEERTRMARELARLALISRVWASHTNFLLIECTDADKVLRSAVAVGLIIRDPRSQLGLKNCLRVTIGTSEQNSRLLRGIAEASGATA